MLRRPASDLSLNYVMSLAGPLAKQHRKFTIKRKFGDATLPDRKFEASTERNPVGT